MKVDPTVQVWLYGSRAKGNARGDSDWDISKDNLSIEEESRFIDHIYDLMAKTGQTI